jgi:hypothetical protein
MTQIGVLCGTASYRTPLCHETWAENANTGRNNRKEKYRDPVTGLHPFVKVIEATGLVYSEAQGFVAEVRRQIEAERDRERERRSRAFGNGKHFGSGELKSIDVFRTNLRYGGDGTRIDLAYATYALSRGATEGQVETALRSRDLSHKGGERRQADYVERTIKKALESARSTLWADEAFHGNLKLWRACTDRRRHRLSNWPKS